ncbi:MAG: transmembrane anchor protein, partial [Hyphomonas sp. 32-62-5]
EVVLTLAPGEAAEIKLTMKAGETAQYEWAVQSGNLNSDLHGDGKGGQATSYRKGRAEAGNAGELTAAFDGAHGWFWRNGGDADVQLTLRVRGAYTEVKRVI